MGTILISQIITKASQILFDVNNVKWPQTELLGWVNSGQRAVVAAIPEAASNVQVMQLTAGARQLLPSGNWLLLQATRNMGTNGATPGRALKRVDQSVLEETNPNWSSQPQQSAPVAYMVNARDRAGFYVSPPADGTGWIEVILSLNPQEQAAVTSAIYVLDIYEPALIDYVLWRALSKKSPYADNMAAAGYYQSFASLIGINTTAIGKLDAETGQVAALQPQGQGSA